MAGADDVRSVVLGRASLRCEYCHIDGWELQVEDVVPRSARYRATPSLSFGGEHRLFNPRSDQWEAHFAWSADYLRILPLNGWVTQPSSVSI
jgi:hypothetical protein